MEGFAGVAEEEAVFDPHAGADGAGDVDPAAFVGGGDDVEGCESKAEDEADGGVEDWCHCFLADGCPDRYGGEGVAGHDGGGGVGEPDGGDG